jgi:mannosyltransferase
MEARVATDTREAEAGASERPGLGVAEWLVVALFTGLVAAFPAQHAFWYDETSSVGHIGRPFLQAIVHDPNHPAGYYAYLWVWTHLVGLSDAAVRLASTPPACLAMVVALLLGRRLVGRQAALVGGLLMAVSPFCLLYCRMARYFSLVLLLTPLCLLLMLRAREKRTWLAWVAWGASAAAAAYVDYVSPLAIALVCVWFVLRHRRDGRVLRQWLLGLAVACCLYAPWAARVVSHVRTIYSHGSMELHGSLKGAAVKLGLPYYSLAVGETTEPWRWPVVGLGVVAFGVLGVVGLRRLWRTNRDAAVFSLVSVGGGVLAGYFVLSAVGTHTPASRMSSLVLFIAPVAYALVGAGALAPAQRTIGVAGLFALLVVSGYGVVNYFRGEQFLNPAYAADWREAAAYVDGRDGPADAIVTTDASFTWYYDGPARASDPPMDEDAVTWTRELAEATAAAGGSIWVVRRDRGFREMVAQTDAVCRELEALGWAGTRQGFGTLSDTSVAWRERLLGRGVSRDYIQVWQFRRPGQPPGGGARGSGEG